MNAHDKTTIGPLPLWFPAVLFVAPIAALGPWDATDFTGDEPWWSLVAVIAIWALSERSVYRRIGVPGRLELRASVLGPVILYVLVASVVINFVIGFAEGGGSRLSWVTVGVLVGLFAAGAAILEHRLVLRAAAREQQKQG